MNVATLQARLLSAGRDPGPPDGVMGVRTLTALLDRLCAHAPAERLRDLAAAMVAELPLYDVWTVLRLQHFLAQALHETGGLVNLVELGGPTYCRKYDGRTDLGNVEPGDGYRFRGRGIFQVTGRANYRTYGAKVGIDLEVTPDRAAEPALAVLLAALYWNSRSINRAADADDLEAVTRKINGGVNGLRDRRVWLDTIRAVWGAPA